MSARVVALESESAALTGSAGLLVPETSVGNESESRGVVTSWRAGSSVLWAPLPGNRATATLIATASGTARRYLNRRDRPPSDDAVDCARASTDCCRSARKGSREDEAIGEAELECKPDRRAGENRFIVLRTDCCCDRFYDIVFGDCGGMRVHAPDPPLSYLYTFGRTRDDSLQNFDERLSYMPCCQWSGLLSLPRTESEHAAAVPTGR